MKKKLLTFILVGTMLTAASVIGCGKSAQDAQTSANTETKADTETAAEDNADSETGSVQINGAIENSDMAFNCNNTVITVRQGQIVQIIRYWVP